MRHPWQMCRGLASIPREGPLLGSDLPWILAPGWPSDQRSGLVSNHEPAIAMHYMHYNFCRIHRTLRVTPAMEAGISDHVWSIEELIGLMN